MSRGSLQSKDFMSEWHQEGEDPVLENYALKNAFADSDSNQSRINNNWFHVSDKVLCEYICVFISTIMAVVTAVLPR